MRTSSWLMTSSLKISGVRVQDGNSPLEVVEVLALDDTAHELLTMQVLAWAQSHSVHVVRSAFKRSSYLKIV